MGVRTYPDLPRVYLDMDGPIADFDEYCRINSIYPEQAKVLSGTYLYLPEVPGTREAIQRIESLGYFVFVLSKIPSDNVAAATEKHMWLHLHYPELQHKLILSPDKGCVGTKRDFLIDDHPEWANANNFPGTVLKFQTSTNNQTKDVGDLEALNWDQIIQILRDRVVKHNSSFIEP